MNDQSPKETLRLMTTYQSFVRRPLRVRIHQIEEMEEYAIFDYTSGDQHSQVRRITDFNEVSKEIERRTDESTKKDGKKVRPHVLFAWEWLFLNPLQLAY